LKTSDLSPDLAQGVLYPPVPEQIVQIWLIFDRLERC